MKKYLLIITCFLSSCAAGLAADNKLAKREIKVGKYERSYYIRYPLNYSSQSRLPLLIVLHGGGRRNGDEVAKHTGFADMSDKENFVAVFPNGFKGKWHDGRLPDRERKLDDYIKRQNNDIAFINQLIDYLVKYEQIDPDRVYMTGLSNGGMMTMRMVCESSEKLAAVAPVIANMPVDIKSACEPKRPVSFLLMNGTEDPMVPWKGGEVTAFFKERGKVLSTEDTMKFWMKKNQCDPESEKITTKANTNANDLSVVDKLHYQCKNKNEMVLYRIRGGGHTLPGSEIRNMPRILGNKNMDINGAQAIWNFLEKQKRSSPSDTEASK